jgi:hypothetical protein
MLGAIAQRAMLRAQEQAPVGFMHLDGEVRAELLAALRSLVIGIDYMLYEVGQTATIVSRYPHALSTSIGLNT